MRDGAGAMQSACGGSAAAETATEGVGASEGAGAGTKSALHVDSISLEGTAMETEPGVSVAANPSICADHLVDIYDVVLSLHCACRGLDTLPVQ